MSAPETIPPSPSLRERLLARFGRGGIALLVVIALIGVAALTNAIEGDHPWDKNIAKRISQHLPLRVKDYRTIGLWWGCVAASIISGVLLICAHWWLPGGKTGGMPPASMPSSPGRWAMMALVVIMSAAAWLRAPLLTQSLWNDEEYSMRRHAHGQWTEDKDGRKEFHSVTWADTLFDCHTGNNHHFSSLMTRLSLDAWRLITGAPREAFSESALRAPSLIAGILTLALLVMLGMEMGSPWVGWGAAGLLAVHPWHVRMAVEARGYSLMLFFLCLALIGLIRAFRTNSIAAWLVFAVGEAGCLLSFAGTLYAVAALNAFAVLEFLGRREPRRIGTLVGFNLLAAIPVIIWLLPSVPQILNYLAGANAVHYPMGWGWMRDLMCFLLSGAHYDLPEMGTHLGTTWLEQITKSAAFQPFIAWALPPLAVIGVITALFRNTATRLAIGSIVVGGVAAYLHNEARGNPMLIVYVIFLLIPFVLAVPLAVATIVGRNRVQAAATLVMLALFAFVTHDIRDHLKHDRQPMRQTVESIYSAQPKALTACFGVSGHNTQSYDPFVRPLEGGADLDAALTEAGRQGRPLFVYFCGVSASRDRKPELVHRVLDQAAFKHIRDFPGLEALFSYHVYRAVNSADPGAKRE